MFKRVGKEIKTWARVLVVLEMIPVVMAGVALAIMAGVYDEELLILGILGGIVVILLGYFLVRLANIMLYAKGELVDRVMRIDEKLEKLERMQAPAPYAPPAPAPYAPPSYGYVPPAPAPVVNNPIQTPQVVKPTVQPAPVAPKPVAAAPVDPDPVLEEDYTVAAFSRPTPSPVVTAPVQNAPADWTCPNCGQRNNADGNWCRNCGTKKNI